MKRFLTALLGATFFLLLSACSPKYETTFDLVPPPTPQGKACANTCLSQKQQCNQTCNTQTQNCTALEYMLSQANYFEYLNQSKKDQSTPTRSADSFYNRNSCNAGDCLNGCVNDYYVCHTNCGGRVIPRSRCVKNCR